MNSFPKTCSKSRDRTAGFRKISLPPVGSAFRVRLKCKYNGNPTRVFIATAWPAFPLTSKMAVLRPLKMSKPSTAFWPVVTEKSNGEVHTSIYLHVSSDVTRARSFSHLLASRSPIFFITLLHYLFMH